MTLELDKVMAQVDALAREAASGLEDTGKLLKMAREWLHEYAGRFEELAPRAVEFSTAIPTGERLDAVHPTPGMPERFTVIGADGSEIPPDPHGAALYYLINTASLTYRHGSGETPVSYCSPELCYHLEDLYEGYLLVRGNLLDVRRDTAEIARLADAVEAEVQGTRPPGGQSPLVALADGTLLLWVLEESPEDRRCDKVEAYIQHLDRIKTAGAVLGGFTSRPRYPEVLKLVWLASLGPRASKPAMDDHPFLGLSDRDLFDFLQPGERSACFVSPSPVNKCYESYGQTIGFFYLNVGTQQRPEIARIEVPEWVYGSPALLDQIHGAILAQCRLVAPYPYVLARAHELAVVSADERRQLETFVQTSLIRHGVKSQVSQKTLLKGLTGGARRRFGR